MCLWAIQPLHITSAYVKDDTVTEFEITEPSQHPSREGDGMRDMVAGGGLHCENV